MSYLLLTGLMLLELLLIAGGLLVFRRFGSRRVVRRSADGGHGARLLAFLEFEIKRMQNIVEELPEGHPDRLIVEKRLNVFNNERDILLEVRATGRMADYPALIAKYYRDADLTRTPEFNKLQGAIVRYQERIANLEKFRTLFFRSQDDLAQVVNRVVDLKRRLDVETLNEEELAALVAQLEQERQRLSSELNIADHELEAIMSNIGQFHDTNVDCNLPDKAEMDGMLEQMRGIEEENEFLQVQIQHLLKAEIEQEQRQGQEMTRLTQELAAQVARYEELESRFVEMETRYLRAVG